MKSSDHGINRNSDSKWVSAGLLAALSASLCCITPVLALISGTSGMVATFSWTEPLRPYLIGITTVVLGVAWYQKLRPRKQEQIDCDCQIDGKEPFVQSKGFLSIITALAIALLTFPSYSHIFYSNINNHYSSIFMEQDRALVDKVEFSVQGMTCSGCEAHIQHEVGMLPGIKSVKASYDKGTTMVEFASSSVNLEQIKNAINKTGYKVMDEKRILELSSGRIAENISFFKVPLVCNAATSIGCGSRSKPVLMDLENTSEVKEAWLNRQGSVIAIVWEQDVSLTDRNKTVGQMFKKHNISPDELVLNNYAENLDSFSEKENWYRGEDVNQLSQEEATIIAKRLLDAIKLKAVLNLNQEQKIRTKIETSFYDFFLNFKSMDELGDPHTYKKILSDIKTYGNSIVNEGKMPELDELWSICANDVKNCNHNGSKGASCCKAKKL